MIYIDIHLTNVFVLGGVGIGIVVVAVVVLAAVDDFAVVYFGW